MTKAFSQQIKNLRQHLLRDCGQVSRKFLKRLTVTVKYKNRIAYCVSKAFKISYKNYTDGINYDIKCC